MAEWIKPTFQIYLIKPINFVKGVELLQNACILGTTRIIIKVLDETTAEQGPRSKFWIGGLKRNREPEGV